jgi:hypothetical protein
VAAESQSIAEGTVMSGLSQDALAATVARCHQHEAIAARYRRLFGETEAVQVRERKVHVPVKPWEDAFIMRLKQGGMTFREISEALARHGSIRRTETVASRYYLLAGRCNQTLTEVAA